jgi:hypothetical protein
MKPTNKYGGSSSWGSRGPGGGFSRKGWWYNERW